MPKGVDAIATQLGLHPAVHVLHIKKRSLARCAFLEQLLLIVLDDARYRVRAPRLYVFELHAGDSAQTAHLLAVAKQRVPRDITTEGSFFTAQQLKPVPSDDIRIFVVPGLFRSPGGRIEQPKQA